VQAVVSKAVGGGVEEVSDGGGGGEGGEGFGEEGGVVAAGGFEEEFARGGALGGGVVFSGLDVGGRDIGFTSSPLMAEVERGGSLFYRKADAGDSGSYDML